MNVLDHRWYGNSLWEWGAAALLALAAFIALAAFRRAAMRRMAMYAKSTQTELDDAVAEVLAATRLWLFFPLALYAGAAVLDLPARLDRSLALLLIVTLLAQSALWANRFVELWFARRLERRGKEDGAAATTLALLGFAARVALWTLVLLLALRQLGFDITALLAGLGIGGIAVALAMQNILGDLFASLSIVLDKPFVIGDFIVVDDLRGTVEYVGLKTTRMRSLDGELIVFSNADLLKSRVRNFRRMHERRIAFTLGVTYQTPAAKLARVPVLIREIIESQPRTRFDRAHFKSYGDFALIFEAVYYVLDPDYNIYMDVQQEINLAIFRRFESEGVEFAYPTQMLYVRTDSAPQPARQLAESRQ